MNWVQDLLALQKQYKMYPLVSFFAFINTWFIACVIVVVDIDNYEIDIFTYSLKIKDDSVT